MGESPLQFSENFSAKIYKEKYYKQGTILGVKIG